MRCKLYIFKKITLIVLFLILANNVRSQSFIFEKVCDYSNFQSIYDFIMTDDLGFVLGHRSCNTIYVTKFDNNGDSLWTYTIGQKGSYCGMQIIQAKNTDLLVATSYDSTAFFIRLSSDGDSITSFKQIRLNMENKFNLIAELPNGDYIIREDVFYKDASYPAFYYLHRYSTSGDNIWESYFYCRFVSSIIVSNENEINLFIIDYCSRMTKMNLTKIDSLGNLLSANIIYDSCVPINVIESSSGSYYAAVKGNEYSNRNPFYALKMDTLENVEWTLFNQAEFDGFPNTVSQLQPNLFSICGEIRNKLVIKSFNKTGDSISTFEYDKYDYQFAQRVCSDGENITVAGGITDSTGNRSILIIKMPIDSFITSASNEQIIKYDNTPYFYPNPANSNIFFTDEIKLFNKEISIYNQLGRKMLYKNNITNSLDISSLKCGVFIMEVKYDEQVIRKKLIIR